MSLAASFIDLATYDELEKYFYSAEQDAVTYFVRQTRKSSWFTQIPVKFSTIGAGDFGTKQWTVTIARGGDYLLNAWLEVTTPVIAANISGTAASSTVNKWCKNFMHNLVDYVDIKFNDLLVQRIDHYMFDFLSEIMIPSDQKKSYREMTGYGKSVLDSNGKNQFIVGLDAGVSHKLKLPLPFFFTRDTGVALPCAALPYNEMKFEFTFRKLSELLVTHTFLKISEIASVTVGTPSVAWAGAATSGYGGLVNISGTIVENSVEGGYQGTSAYAGTTASLSEVNVWGTYAMVSNVERAMMAKTARNIIIEQYTQHSPVKITSATSSYDIRFAHAIKALFIAARSPGPGASLHNQTTGGWAASAHGGVGAGYTTNGSASPTYQPGWFVTDRGIAGHRVTANPVTGGYGGDTYSNYSKVNLTAEFGGVVSRTNPISDITVTYENTKRLDKMDAGYFTQITPYYTAVSSPEEVGINLYSYSLDMSSVDPMGSTNFGKLTNVSVTPTVDTTYATGTGSTSEMIITAINHNVIKISGGALGFPIL